jgi:hypothetical protein
LKRFFHVLLAICLSQQTLLVALANSGLARESIQQSQSADATLDNEVILHLAKMGLTPDVIIARIKSSRNDFSVSPEKLHELKISGVADDVLSAMVEASKAGATSEAVIPLQAQKPGALQIPNGTPVDIEAPYTINSMDFKVNDQISFRVVNPVKVDGITVIEQGATATARIDKAKRGGHFGKAGLFVFSMQSVTAVDGTQIPLRVNQVRLRGDSKAAKVATQMIITGALLPIIAPLALLHGFKRGENAFIPAGKRYQVLVNGQAPVKNN